MKSSIVFGGVALVAGLATAQPQIGDPIAYRVFRYGNIRVHMVQADLSDGRVMARVHYSWGLEAPWSMISAVQPFAAITGTFFAPANGVPVADVLVDGELLASGNRGSAVGIDYSGNVHIFDQSFRRSVDWTPFRYGLRGAVRLISNSVVNPNPKAQSFRDKNIWGRAARTGVGVNRAGKLILMATEDSVTLSEFGRAMRSQGVVDAVSLDGGNSTMLYYGGTMKIGPQRNLSNILTLDWYAN